MSESLKWQAVGCITRVRLLQRRSVFFIAILCRWNLGHSFVLKDTV